MTKPAEILIFPKRSIEKRFLSMIEYSELVIPREDIPA
jgi:hypothetical protein